MWNYTPKQASGFVRLARKRLKGDFYLRFLAARGKGETVDQTLRDWEKDE